MPDEEPQPAKIRVTIRERGRLLLSKPFTPEEFKEEYGLLFSRKIDLSDIVEGILERGELVIRQRRNDTVYLMYKDVL